MQTHTFRSRLIRSLLPAIALFSLAGCATPWETVNLKVTRPDTGFIRKQITVDGERRDYAVFVPLDYTSAQRWPVIVFLHGRLEAGTQVLACTKVGIGPAIAKRLENFPFIVAFPQVDDFWTGDGPDHTAMAVLDQVQRDYSTDPDRVILTGLSTGGFGTWLIGARHADRFAALAPMACYADFDDIPKLLPLPIWCFHNRLDYMIPPADNTREMYNRIKAQGGNIQYTEYPSVGHDCWDQAYGESGLLDWMAQQRRGVRNH